MREIEGCVCKEFIIWKLLVLSWGLAHPKSAEQAPGLGTKETWCGSSLKAIYSRARKIHWSCVNKIRRRVIKQLRRSIPGLVNSHPRAFGLATTSAQEADPLHSNMSHTPFHWGYLLKSSSSQGLSQLPQSLDHTLLGSTTFISFLGMYPNIKLDICLLFRPASPFEYNTMRTEDFFFASSFHFYIPSLRIMSSIQQASKNMKSMNKCACMYFPKPPNRNVCVCVHISSHRPIWPWFMTYW